MPRKAFSAPARDASCASSIGAPILLLVGLTTAIAQADDLHVLLASKRCEVVDRLRRIHAAPELADEQNRFLILSRADAPQDYVQCAFMQRDRRMLCEAASGFFYDVPRTMHLKPAAIAALGRLGFSTDDAEPRNSTRASRSPIHSTSRPSPT